MDPKGSIYCLYCKRYDSWINRKAYGIGSHQGKCRASNQPKFIKKRDPVTGAVALEYNSGYKRRPFEVKQAGWCAPKLTCWGKLRKILHKQIGPQNDPAPNGK